MNTGGSMNLNKALPGLYLCSGLGITCNLDSALCFFSGTFLMLLACMIWIKRAESQNHRTIISPVKHISMHSQPGSKLARDRN